MNARQWTLIASCVAAIAAISWISRHAAELPAFDDAPPAAPEPHRTVVTHAVAKASTAPSAKVDPSVLYVPKHAPRYARAELLAAARMAAHSGYCTGGRAVTAGGYLPSDQRDPDHPDAPYYVNCALPDRIDPGARQIYFTRADIAHHRVPMLLPPADANTATELCLDATRAKLLHGSTADFSFWSLRVGTGGTRNQRVDVDLTALNGFGNRVPMHATCIVDPHRRVDVTIAGR